MSLASLPARWWNAVRPLPPIETPGKAALALKRKQRKLIWSAAAMAAVLAGGWFIYDYIAGAPQRAQTEFARGMLKMGAGGYAEAVAFFNRAIVIQPELADAYLNRGIAEHNLRQTEAALADLDKASDLNSGETRAYDERGRISLEKGETRRAIEQFTKSIRIHGTTDGYYQRGLAYELMGEHREAVADFDSAIAELRDAPYAYRARAQAKANLGDAEGAKQDRDMALRIESH